MELREFASNLFLLQGTEFRVVFSFAEGFGSSESLLLFLLNGTEFRAVFFSAEGFGMEFRELCVPRNSRNSVGNNHLFRLFRFPRNQHSAVQHFAYWGSSHRQPPPPRNWAHI